MKRCRWVLCTLWLVGCVRSGDPQLYTLAASRPQATWDPALVVELRRPHIAGYLDRRELVLRVEAQRLVVNRRALWAEPLDALLGRTLAEDLALRLPNSQVFSELSHVHATPTVIVDVSVQRFEQEQEELVLQALVGLHGQSGRADRLERVALRTRPRARDAAALARAMTELLGELADGIARQLAGP